MAQQFHFVCYKYIVVKKNHVIYCILNIFVLFNIFVPIKKEREWFYHYKYFNEVGQGVPDEMSGKIELEVLK